MQDKQDNMNLDDQLATISVLYYLIEEEENMNLRREMLNLSIKLLVDIQNEHEKYFEIFKREIELVLKMIQESYDSSEERYKGALKEFGYLAEIKLQTVIQPKKIQEYLTSYGITW